MELYTPLAVKHIDRSVDVSSSSSKQGRRPSVCHERRRGTHVKLNIGVIPARSQTSGDVISRQNIMFKNIRS